MEGRGGGGGGVRVHATLKCNMQQRRKKRVNEVKRRGPCDVLTLAPGSLTGEGGHEEGRGQGAVGGLKRP